MGSGILHNSSLIPFQNDAAAHSKDRDRHKQRDSANARLVQHSYKKNLFSKLLKIGINGLSHVWNTTHPEQQNTFFHFYMFCSNWSKMVLTPPTVSEKQQELHEIYENTKNRDKIKNI